MKIDVAFDARASLRTECNHSALTQFEFVATPSAENVSGRICFFVFQLKSSMTDLISVSNICAIVAIPSLGTQASLIVKYVLH